MEFSLEVKANILILRFSGNRDEDGWRHSVERIWTTVAKRCVREQLTRILLLGTARGKQSNYNAYQFYSNLGTYGIQKTWKIAYVRNMGDQDSVRYAGFAESIAFSKGFTRWRAFDSIEEAKAWLQEDRVQS